VQTLHQKSPPAAGQSPFFFPGVVESTKLQLRITWSPDGKRFVFMSNGGEATTTCTCASPTAGSPHHDRQGEGRHADWSPNGDRIAFISGRSGKGTST